MKITRNELELRVLRTIDNFYNYEYTSEELAREQTEFHYLIRDLKIYKNNGGNVFDFRDSFLNPLFTKYDLEDEQEDFIQDIIDVINDNCPEWKSLNYKE